MPCPQRVKTAGLRLSPAAAWFIRIPRNLALRPCVRSMRVLSLHKAFESTESGAWRVVQRFIPGVPFVGGTFAGTGSRLLYSFGMLLRPGDYPALRRTLDPVERRRCRVQCAITLIPSAVDGKVPLPSGPRLTSAALPIDKLTDRNFRETCNGFRIHYPSRKAKDFLK